MAARPIARSGPAGATLLPRLIEIILLVLPTLLLLIATVRQDGQSNLMLSIGTGFEAIVCGLSFVSRYNRRDAIAPSVITLYIIATGWLWLGTLGSTDWYPHFAQAILLVTPLIVFALQILTDSGAPAICRAQSLAAALANRRDWPNDLAACRTLPEVKALREALHVDAAPALALLRHKRVEVRLAALAAMEFRQNWRPGQPEVVLRLALRAEEPPVRAAALAALGNVTDRELIESVAEFLRDPSWEVRRAATEALLWDTEHRWGWIRHAVRRTLGDPACQEDGPLYCHGQPLTPEAVADLTAWCAEKGAVGIRASQTLGAHYTRVLSEGASPEVLDQLHKKLIDPHAPAALRIELARVLRSNQELDRDLLENLLDAANPAPLRLSAVEALMAKENHPGALAALHDLARLPNREIALATAVLVQRRLGIDLGVPPDQPLPPIHSRQAAEISRRVLHWAAKHDEMNEEVAPILIARMEQRA